MVKPGASMAANSLTAETILWLLKSSEPAEVSLGQYNILMQTVRCHMPQNFLRE